MSDKDNLIEIINLCWNSVNESTVGPILLPPKDGVAQVNNVAMQTFLTVLSNVTPKNIQSRAVEPKEPWQNE